MSHFLTLADLLHFGKASQACNLSPSALTRSIQRTEESLGQTLFIRDNRTVTLTSAGEKFRHYAKSALRDWEDFQAKMLHDERITGIVSIYASVTAVYSLLPDLLESYRADFPEVALELRTGSAEESIQQVINGEIDVSVAALPDKKTLVLSFSHSLRPIWFLSPRKIPPTRRQKTNSSIWPKLHWFYHVAASPGAGSTNG